MILDGNIITREELSLIFFGDKDADSFYDIFENDSASPRFDCVNSVGECPGNGECYIIDRETGHYINWYKLYHFGRDLHTNMTSKEEIVRFAKDFFDESEKKDGIEVVMTRMKRNDLYSGMEADANGN